jgi:hypothetical protein
MKIKFLTEFPYTKCPNGIKYKRVAHIGDIMLNVGHPVLVGFLTCSTCLYHESTNLDGTINCRCSIDILGNEL